MDRVIKANTGDLADTFRGSAYVCLACATCFADSRLLTSNLWADERGYACKPMVALDSATDERPAWRDLVRGLTVGMQAVAVFTSNTKRRLWTQAQVSVIGSHWRPLMVDGVTERSLIVDFNRLLATLDEIEALLDRGLSKRAIGESLIVGLPLAEFARDVAGWVALEKRIAAMRATDEFLLALFIAQKTILEK